ncbi:hypothetical protein TNCV_4276861 [Trichonephila clavipes]|nr:hypothetical protein TNCV_4276861 [Trichonephila clavipes]
MLLGCEAPDQSVVSQQYSHSQFDLGSSGVHNLVKCTSYGIIRGVPHEEQAGQKVKDEQEVQHQQELVYTSEML